MYDPCECFISHEAMMRRLFNILRQSQDECTDGDCTTNEINPTSNTYFLGLIILLLFGMIMFYTRPASLRSSNSSNEKPPRNSGDQFQQPPPSLG